MRRAQLVRKRRFSFLLFSAALCWVGVAMGFDIRSGLFTKDFSTFLENKLNTLFVDKEVRLSRIGGGVFSKLAIDDLSISQKLSNSEGNPLPVFSVDRIIIKYNLLNLILRRFEKLRGVYLISPSLFVTPNQSSGLVLPTTTSSVIRGSGYCGQPIRLHILNGTISGLDKKPILTNLTGAVTFYNSALTFNNLRGTFFNLPVLVNGRIEHPFEAPVIRLRLFIKDRYYTARVLFKTNGQKGEGCVWGNLNLLDKFNTHFKGRINIASGESVEIKDLLVQDLFTINGEINLATKSNKFVITSKTGLINVITNLRQGKGLAIHANLNHINLFGHDVISQIDINTSLHEMGSSPSILRGVLKTQNLILNYKPFKEIKASWVLKKDNLFINALELGDEYRLFGKVGLERPYNMDLDLTIINGELGDWIIFSKYDQTKILSGVMNGRVKIWGPLTAPNTKGRFEVRDGNIKDIRYNCVNFNLVGKGAILTVSDSRIFKEDGFLYIDGEIDLRKFGKRNIFEDIEIKTDQKVIVWEGWDISKDIDTSEIKLKKEINEDFRVNFKTYSNAGPIDERDKKNEVGLDYKIRDSDSVNVRMKEDSAFVGLEHKIKF